MPVNVWLIETIISEEVPEIPFTSKVLCNLIVKFGFCLIRVGADASTTLGIIYLKSFILKGKLKRSRIHFLALSDSS